MLDIERMHADLIQQLGIPKRGPSKPTFIYGSRHTRNPSFALRLSTKGSSCRTPCRSGSTCRTIPHGGKEQADRIRDQVLSPLLSR